jgi:hypothetical protein
VNEKGGDEWQRVAEVVECLVGVSPPEGGGRTAERGGEEARERWASGEKKKEGFWAVMLATDSQRPLIYVIACSMSSNKKNRVVCDELANTVPSFVRQTHPIRKKTEVGRSPMGYHPLRKRGLVTTAFPTTRQVLWSAISKPVGAERPDLNANVQTPIKKVDQIERMMEAGVTGSPGSYTSLGLATAAGRP